MSGLRPAALRVLEAELRDDLHRVLRERDEIARLAGRITDEEDANDLLWAMAAHIQAFYSGVEAILKKVLARLDGELPHGQAWHQELLRRATLEIPLVRPPLLSPSLAEDLKAYLSFRHFLRHTYGAELRWEKMAEMARQISAVHAAFAAHVERFVQFLHAVTEVE